MKDSAKLKQFTTALKRLTEDIFACFLHPEYADNLYFFEHRIHHSKTNCLIILQHLANTTDISRQLLLYNILLDCGLLRSRVSDKAIFEICRKEFTAILEAITHQTPENPLSAHITALEVTYQNVLLVTSQQPLPFLLFIYSLKALEQELLV